MNKTLFIDFDGTLCHDRFWRGLNPSLKERVQNHLFVENKDLVGQWMKGVFTSEEINQKLVDDLGIEYQELWSVFVGDCESMFIEPAVLERIKELREKYKVFLVTDNMDCFDRFTVPALKLKNYFDGIVNSFNEKTFKNENDGALFRKIVEGSGSEVSESILLDNSNKSCETFEKMGGKSLFVTAEKPLSFWLATL